MTISVLIAVYNAEDTIKAAIESILNQTFRDFEIIVIDDGSTDNTVKIIEELYDERIAIYSNLTNLGQTKSLNKGIQYCSGEYIARMDADDISLPNRFKLQVDAFKKDTELAIVATDAYKMFVNGKIRRQIYRPKNIEVLKFISMYTNTINHISVMIRKECLQGLNLYDESFMISTDWDLWSRALIKGYKIKILRKRCVKFLVTDSTYRARNIKIMEDEDIRIVKRNIYHFTGLEISEKVARDIRNLHYCKSCTLKHYIEMYKVWHNIVRKYKYKSQWNFYLAYIYDIVLLFVKYLRTVLKKICNKKLLDK